jgi:hydroxyacyl-ACP dehydratase HTD2-like protein with hotdog domain
MRSIPSGYAGLKTRTKRDALRISKNRCQSLSQILKGFVSLPDGWLPLLAYRAFDPGVSRAIRLEALKPHIPQLLEAHSLLQTCVQVSGSIRFYGDLPLEQAIYKEYKTELLSDRLYRRSKQIRLLQKTRYISDGLSLLDETTELHYRIKPSRSSSSLVERNHHAEIIDILVVVDDMSLASYVALGATHDAASVDPVYAKDVLQCPGLLVPIDLVSMILMSALHLAMPGVSIGSLEYHTYGQLYTGASLRICASQLSDQQVLIWAESSGYLIFRGVVRLISA